MFTSCCCPRPQAASFEKGKGRQGIIPDILYRKPAKGGEPAREVLLDVKVLNEGSAGYETVANQAELENPTQCGPVNKRAEKVDADYQRNAKKIDTKYNSEPADRLHMGPVESELATYTVTGLGCGAYGDVSDSVLELLDEIAEGLAGTYGQDLGYNSFATQLQMTKRYVMRELSTTIVLENAYMVYQRFQRFRALRSTDESDVMVTDLMDEAPLAQAQAEVMGYNLHATLE